MHPYITQHIAEERRAELLRSAGAERLAHLVQADAAKRPRWWSRLLPRRMRAGTTRSGEESPMTAGGYRP